MDSISQHQYSTDNLFSDDFSEYQNILRVGDLNNGAMWDNRGLPCINSNASLDESLFSAATIPQSFGVSETVEPVWPDYQSSGYGAAGSYMQEEENMIGEDYSVFVPDYSSAPTYATPNAANNFDFHASQVQTMEEPSHMKVVKYSVEERKDRILKYLKKRNQRNFNKTIKYECRKTLADKRVRVRGRFARNSYHCETEEQITLTDNHLHDQGVEFNNDDAVKIEQEGEEWLQEAMASLMYSPYVSG